jgi:hypothetical protein
MLELAYVDIPFTGQATLGTPTLMVDRSRLALRLLGDPRRSLMLRGHVFVLSGRARPTAGRAASGAPALPSVLARPPLSATRLDLRILSHGGAMTVELPYLPDLRLDLDQHVTGTLGAPLLAGRLIPMDAYGAVLLWLDRRFSARSTAHAAAGPAAR